MMRQSGLRVWCATLLCVLGLALLAGCSNPRGVDRREMDDLRDARDKEVKEIASEVEALKAK